MTVSVRRETIHCIGRLIEACDTPGFGKRLHELFGALVDFDNLVVLAFTRNKPPESLCIMYASDYKVQQYTITAYVGGAYQLDPYYLACWQGGRRGMYRLRDIAPDRFFQSEYYKSYYRDVGLADEVGVIAPIDAKADVWLHLALSRAATRPPFSLSELHRLTSFEPVLTPLLVRHWHDAASARLERSRGGLSDAGLCDRILAETSTGSGQPRLSRREAQITAHILRGHSSTSIGLLLHISPHTVKVHRQRIYAKFGISSQAELFARLMPALV